MFLTSVPLRRPVFPLPCSPSAGRPLPQTDTLAGSGVLARLTRDEGSLIFLLLPSQAVCEVTPPAEPLFDWLHPDPFISNGPVCCSVMDTNTNLPALGSACVTRTCWRRSRLHGVTRSQREALGSKPIGSSLQFKVGGNGAFMRVYFLWRINPHVVQVELLGFYSVSSINLK